MAVQMYVSQASWGPASTLNFQGVYSNRAGNRLVEGGYPNTPKSTVDYPPQFFCCPSASMRAYIDQQHS